MQKLVVSMLSSVLIAALSGCATGPGNAQDGQIIGGVLGGVAGAQVGSGTGRTAAVIAGSVAGSLIGGSVGHTMDESDRTQAQKAFEYNRSNQPSSWRNPATGNTYTVTPTSTYNSQSTNQSCREYTTDAIIDGRHENMVGNACRQPDGTWKSVN